jgi:hypothetical protein
MDVHAKALLGRRCLPDAGVFSLLDDGPSRRRTRVLSTWYPAEAATFTSVRFLAPRDQGQ